MLHHDYLPTRMGSQHGSPSTRRRTDGQGPPRRMLRLCRSSYEPCDTFLVEPCFNYTCFSRTCSGKSHQPPSLLSSQRERSRGMMPATPAGAGRCEALLGSNNGCTTIEKNCKQCTNLDCQPRHAADYQHICTTNHVPPGLEVLGGAFLFPLQAGTGLRRKSITTCRQASDLFISTIAV